MNTLEEATGTLRAVESELRASDGNGGLDARRIADQIHRVVELLSDEDARWIDTAKAEKLLGFTVEGAMPTWLRLGLLRSRTLSNGTVQVLLDDVLRRRTENEGLSAFGGDDLTPAELEELSRTRPGTLPWEREERKRSR